MLLGPEVKSLREGRANLSDSYAVLRRGEAFLVNAHVSPYEKAGRENPDPRRERKLLLHRAEIARLVGRSRRARLHARAALRSTSRTGRAKVELGLARGKKLYDKRQTIREREEDREIQRTLRGRRHGALVRRAARAALAALAGCSPRSAAPMPGRSRSLSPLPPDRRDYQAFRVAHPEPAEPNYLPFLAHRLRSRAATKICSACRWPDERLPLAVAIEPPQLPAGLAGRGSSEAARGLRGGRGAWARALGAGARRAVRFRRAAEGEKPTSGSACSASGRPRPRTASRCSA